MQQKQISHYANFLVSGHTFEKDEVLLKFQYQMLNTILLVMGLFSLLFAVLSSLEISPLGTIPTTVDYILVIISAILIVRLRGPKRRYLQVSYFMYASTFISFISILIFVPHDEFRIIWFYLLVIAAYVVGGVRTGDLISLISIVTVISVDIFYDLQLSEIAIITSMFGLVIMSLFIRAYTKTIIDFEREIIEQQNFMIAQSRFAAMGEMISMIAHQWRQPLSTTTLMIANERLNSMMAGKEDSEYDKIFDKISDTMLYLSDTIDDFQTYFKPEKSTQKVEICTLIERVRQFTESRLSMAKVEMHINECNNESINTYANEIVQVFINIINNAIDVLIERDIPDRHIWISITSCDENLTISIEDNAGGIESDIIEKIFEPYFSSKSENGTGLGLYMSKMIIDKHIKGTLEVSNTPKGARFTIVLPKNISL